MADLAHRFVDIDTGFERPAVPAIGRADAVFSAERGDDAHGDRLLSRTQVDRADRETRVAEVHGQTFEGADAPHPPVGADAKREIGNARGCVEHSRLLPDATVERRIIL